MAIKARFRVLIFLLSICLSSTIWAQTTNYKTINKDGKNFYLYEVGPAEGFYSLTHKFNVTQSEIEKYNPETKAGLKNGQKLLIPVKAQSVTPKINPNTGTSFMHTVEAGETLSSIARTYGISVDEILAYNQGLTPSLTIGHSIIIPQPSLVTSGSDNTYVYHTITPKETLFSVAKQYNVSMNQIMDENPGLNDKTFSIGKIIRIKPNTKESVMRTTVEEKTMMQTYEVKRKETFYSISKKFNIPVEDLIAANPDIQKVKSGELINIPSLKTDTIKSIGVDKIQDMFNILTEPTIIDKKGSMKIAIMLPLQLDNINQDNSLQARYIEFYQGFLLAVDSLKSNGLSFDIFVYDTSTKPISQIIKEPNVEAADLIIGPATNEDVAVVSEFAKTKNINMVSPFTFEAESASANPNLFQLNTPSSYLNSETAMEFSNMFKDQNIVFIKERSKPADKKEFLDYLRSDLTARNIKFYDYEFNESDEITKVDSILNIKGDIVFIPQSVKQADLGIILPSLLILKKNNPGLNISVFGFPEWQQFANNFMEHFYELNTYIFSRIYVNPFSEETKRFNNKFQYWYGKEMMFLYPRYGMVGFDTGMYFLTALNRYGRNFENHIDMQPAGSIQTAICFKRINNWSGFINRCIYFVNFRPNGTIEKIIVK